MDVDDLLQKAEQFYKTNVEKLGMATVGQGNRFLIIIRCRFIFFIRQIGLLLVQAMMTRLVPFG